MCIRDRVKALKKALTDNLVSAAALALIEDVYKRQTFNYNKFQDIVEIIAKKGYDITVLNKMCIRDR